MIVGSRASRAPRTLGGRRLVPLVWVALFVGATACGGLLALDDLKYTPGESADAIAPVDGSPSDASIDQSSDESSDEDSSSADAVDSQPSPQDAPGGQSFDDVSDATVDDTAAPPACSFSVPDVSNGALCSCTGNCYDNSWDGCFSIQNTEAFAMTNPVVTFQVPSNITDIAATASTGVPNGFTKTASLDTANSTITISFGGSLAAGASILVYYTDNNQSGPAATDIAVTASNCP